MTDIKGALKKPEVGSLICILALVLSPPCFGQELHVRIVNDKTGKPLQKQLVSISLLYGKNEETPAKYNATLSLETDANGEALFRLPEPAPAHLGVQVHLTSEHWHCSCGILAATEDVIQRGIVDQPGPDSIKSASVKAEPNRIVFIARPFTFFERLLYPLLKG